MPRLLIFIGTLLIAAGVFAPLAQIGTFTIPGLNTPSATSLCSPGETLKTSSGVASHVPGSHSFAQVVRYSCVNAQGVSRDVTSDYVKGLSGEVSGFMKQIFGSVAISTAAPLLGTLFLISGITLAVKRGIAAGTMRVVTPLYADVTAQVKQNGRFGGQSSAHATSNVDAASRLQQLESMLRSNLITENEYQAKRKDILEGL